MRLSASTLFAMATIVGVWAKVWPRVSLEIATASVIVLGMMLWADFKLKPRRPQA
jgi:hypothetical protein